MSRKGNIRFLFMALGLVFLMISLSQASDLILESPLSSGVTAHDGNIIAQNNCMVPTGNDVTLAAFGKVTFRPNFRVQAGGTLVVRPGDYSDTDGDDLPDVWEYKYFGNLDQGRNGDPDSNGSSPNYLEYVFGTNPNNAQEEPPPADAYQDVDMGFVASELEGGSGLLAGSIRITNGNALEFRVDLAFPSPNSLGLTFRVTYNSRATQTGILGYGWFHNFGSALNPSFPMGDRAFLKIIDGTGKAYYFIQEVPGYYSGVFGERGYVKAECLVPVYFPNPISS
jgi:hypothetical protein